MSVRTRKEWTRFVQMAFAFSSHSLYRHVSPDFSDVVVSVVDNVFVCYVRCDKLIFRGGIAIQDTICVVNIASNLRNPPNTFSFTFDNDAVVETYNMWKHMENVNRIGNKYQDDILRAGNYVEESESE